MSEIKDFKHLPPRQIGEVLYQKTKNICKFSKEKIIDLLSNFPNLSTKEEALRKIYYRMYGWFKSLEVLNHTVYYQSLSAATRSLFEMLIDFILIIRDNSTDSVEKFFLFSEAEKLRVAIKLNNYTKQIDQSFQIFLTDHAKVQGIEKKIEQHWGRDKKGDLIFPRHWTNKDMRGRAKDAGNQYLDLYHEIFDKLSWNIHSGDEIYTRHFRKNQFEILFFLLHYWSQQFFSEATILFAKEMKIDQAWESEQNSFYHEMKKIDESTLRDFLYFHFKTEKEKSELKEI